MREHLKRRLVKLEAAAAERDAPPGLVIPGRPTSWPADAETVAAWTRRAVAQQAQLARRTGRTTLR